jgi:galactose oxidase
MCRYRGDDKDAMNGNAVYFDLDKIFTVGGAENYDKGPGSDRAYVIDISGSETVVEKQQNMLFSRTFCNSVVLPNGHILVVGGQSMTKLFEDSDGILNLELFVPEDKKFYELKQPLKYPRNYHAVALLLKDGRVAAGGGGLCGTSCDYNTPSVSARFSSYSTMQWIFLHLALTH